MPFVGGAQISLSEHINYLDSNKFEIFLGCTEKIRNYYFFDELNRKAKIHFLSFGHLKSFNLLILFRLIKSLLEVRSLIKKEAIDIIFCNTVRANIVGSLAAIFFRTKVIWFIQDYTFHRSLFNILSIIPQKIFYVSRSVMDFYGKLEDKKNLVQYIWRDEKKFVFNLNEQERMRLRKELNCSDDQFLVGYIGRLVDWKGPQVLIEVMDILINKEGIKNIKCVIIGSGKGQKDSNEVFLHELASKLKLEDYIFFTGHRNDIPKYLKSLDIFCLTSIEPEPYSSIVIEAMMAGTPVIATKTGGTGERIKNNINGFLVNPNSPTELSKIIKNLLENSLLSQKIAEQAFLDIRENSAKVLTKILECEYFELLK